jgi:hypothetical protein
MNLGRKQWSVRIEGKQTRPKQKQDQLAVLSIFFKCIPIANGFGDGVKIHIIRGAREGDSQRT